MKRLTKILKKSLLMRCNPQNSTHTCSLLLSFLSTLFVFSSLSFADPNIASNSNSATCDDSTLETYSGTSNLSANWGANTINLHWYADSEATTELTGSGIPTSCVYDGALTPPPVSSIPQKTGYTFAGWKVRGLPDGYTKLQYIQSSGTQYIDTGLKANLNTKAVAKIMLTDNASAYWAIFGARETKTSKAFTVWDIITKFSCQYSSSGGMMSNTDTIINTPYVIELSSAGLNINGNDLTTINNPASFTTPSNVLLFNIGGANANTTGNNVNRIMVGRFYYFRLYQSGTLVRNMIPAKNSNNVVGMWDTVTKTFFTNVSGSGSFTAGPVVQ